MIAYVWRIVARAAGSLKRGDTAGNQAASRHIVIDAGYIGDVDGPGVENSLPARNRGPRGCGRHRRPGVKGIEDRGIEVPVARRCQSARWFKVEQRRWEQKADAGVDADEKWLGGERDRPASRAVRV